MSANCVRALIESKKKLGTHAHHRDRSAAAAIFANGTYFLDNLRMYEYECIVSTQVISQNIMSITILEFGNTNLN
jgi:hypothetical protein